MIENNRMYQKVKGGWKLVIKPYSFRPYLGRKLYQYYDIRPRPKRNDNDDSSFSWDINHIPS